MNVVYPKNSTSSLPLAMAGLKDQSSSVLGLAMLATTLAVFLAYLAYTPSVHALAPEFTTDTSPIIGSWGFYSRRWSFFHDSAKRSRTGHFSFWLGKSHVVGVTGAAGRRLFLDHPDLDRVKTAVMHGIGPENAPPVHGIHKPNFSKGHTYFQRRVLDLMRTEHLAARMGPVTEDARRTFGALRPGGGTADPVDACYRLVLAQNARVVCCDELADTPALFDEYVRNAVALQHLSSGPGFVVPWLPSVAHNRRRWHRYRLKRLLTPLVRRRAAAAAVASPAPVDALQLLLDSGDSEDYMVTLLISILFISIANAGKVAGVMLHLICSRPDWQDRVRAEVVAAVRKTEPSSSYSSSSSSAAAAAAAPPRSDELPPRLADRLAALSIETWETSFPFVDQLLREAIRFHVSFPMTRLNDSPRPIPIPGAGQVIPAGSYVAYHTNDAHLNHDLYPDPLICDPDRYAPGREASKNESYSFLAWGNGRHRCVGQRWAKLQITINIAYAVAMFKWSSCDADGNVLPPTNHSVDRDTHGNQLAKGILARYEPLEK